MNPDQLYRLVEENGEEEVKCDICGTVEDSDIEEFLETPDETLLCDTCYHDQYYQCEQCDEWTNRDDIVYCEYNSRNYCESCWSENVGSCYDCGEEVPYDDLNYVERRDVDICGGCYDEEQHRRQPNWYVESNNMVRTNTHFVHPRRNLYSLESSEIVTRQSDDFIDFKDSFDKVKSRRCMGIEIEYNDDNSSDREDIYYRLHIALAKKNGVVVDPHNWSDAGMRRSLIVTSDGSITSENHPYGKEVILEPRRGDILASDVETITSELIKARGYVSSNCGLHLHVDSRDYDWYHFAVLTMMTKLIEPQVFSMLPSSRRVSRWCHPVSQTINNFSGIDGRDSFVNFYYDGERYHNDKYHDKRYHGLNLHSHFQANQGVEIRYHSGTLNADKIIHWSIFWSKVVDKCFEIGDELYQKHHVQSDEGIWWKNSGFMSSIRNPVGLSEDEVNRLSQKYHTRTIATDLGDYHIDAEHYRSLLGLSKQERPYNVQQLATAMGLSMGLGRFNQPTMTLRGMFDLFEIPYRTQMFMRKRTSDIMNSPDTPEDHLLACFTRTTRFVEFNRALLEFKNVDWLEHRLPTLADEYRYRFHKSLDVSKIQQFTF